jgi:hypothetical protein
MKPSALSLALLLGVLSISVNAQTEIPKAPLENDAQSEVLKRLKALEIEINGESNPVLEAFKMKDVHNSKHKPSLQLHELALSDEENEIVKNLLERVKNDKKTIEMIEKMRSEQSQTLESMFGGMSGPEKVRNLKKMIFELQAVEVLFKDPVRAVKMMNEEGLIPAARLSEYERNPQLLEDDTRKGLYFSFVTVAVSLDLV